jgi:transcription antitermination factor NusG
VRADPRVGECITPCLKLVRREMPILARETDLYPPDLLDRDELGREPDRRWWAVYTRSRREKDLMRRLKAMQLAFYGPTVAKSQRSPSGRVRTSFVPLFTNYVFVYGDAAARYHTLETSCVSSCIEVIDGQTLSRELRSLRRLIATSQPLTVEERLEPNAVVRVKSGPLRGIEGVVVCRRGRHRLVVSVTFLQQGASVEIDDFMVEPL